MLSKKKIRIMFRMASYETGIGKKDLKTVKFYKSDYIRLNILKSIVSMTVAYVLIIALCVMYHLEYIVKHAVNIQYEPLGLKLLGVYIILILIYTFISVLVYAVRYDAARKRVQRYFKHLKYLRKYYQNDSDEYEEETDDR